MYIICTRPSTTRVSRVYAARFPRTEDNPTCPAPVVSPLLISLGNGVSLEGKPGHLPPGDRSLRPSNPKGVNGSLADGRTSSPSSRSVRQADLPDVRHPPGPPLLPGPRSRPGPVSRSLRRSGSRSSRTVRTSSPPMSIRLSRSRGSRSSVTGFFLSCPDVMTSETLSFPDSFSSWMFLEVVPVPRDR